MRVLAQFLASHGDAILELFARRVQATVAPAGVTRGEIVNHLHDFLAVVIEALDAGVGPRDPAIARLLGADEHGAQRLRLGFDLSAVIGEYGLLRECILELMDDVGATPSLRELRVLSACITETTDRSVQRHLAERRDAAEEERGHLLELFQQAPGFVAFLRGRDQVFELANAAYFQLVGHRDILGKPVREALPEVAGQGYFELLDRVFTSGEPFIGRAMKVALQREPGAPLTEAHIDLIYQPIRDGQGQITGLLAQGQDVTEVKRQENQRELAEAALRASEERYRTLFESIDDGFCLMQLLFDADDEPVDYRFIETNAAFEGHTGLVGAVGKRARELVPDLDPSWARMYGRVAVTGESARFENHDPAMGRWFDVYASRVGRPELRQVALVFKNVSERKVAEAERARMFELEQAARQEAEEASRLRDEFLATVSHELRTPLTAILGWVQMLRVGGLPPEKRDRALETVERNARAQAQLIEDLLDVSGILAGKLRLSVHPVNVQTVVEAALETVRPAAQAKDIRLQAMLTSDGMVMGDAHRLQQVVWNLLSNAVKFTPRGGRVQVIVERQESSVEILVADNGRGIVAEFQPHVFERFRQADGATTRAHGGLGLGLSIVRQLVELHGGTVSVYSEGEGHGASFTVRLPMAVAMRRETTPSPALQQSTSAQGVACPPELHGLHVLVVDDEPDTREMLRAMLEQCGVRVRVAGSAAEAFERFVEERPDLLLSDIGMPGEDGYALVEKVRACAARDGGDVPAVALTAYARTEDRTRALLAGFSNHVAKPVEPLELLAVIASLSGRTRQRG